MGPLTLGGSPSPKRRLTGGGPLEYGPRVGISPVFPRFLFRSEDLLEAVEHVGRVAWRLNRVGLQRAAYRSAATVLLGATGAAVCAAYLEPVWFRVLFASVVVLGLAVVVGSLVVLRTRWADPRGAARWVEARVPLEDRLLTLVTAAPETRRSRLWSELEQDNRAQLPRWRDEKLGIPAVPANLVAFLVALVLAAIFLVPSSEEREPLIPPPGVPSPDGPAGAAQQATAGRPAPAPGAAVVRGADGHAGTEGGASEASSSALAAVDRIQADLGEAFRRSFGGQIVSGEREEPEPGSEATAFRGDSPEAGIGETESQPGGAPPAEGLARREDGTATGQEVKSLEPGGQGRSGAGGQGGKARPSQESGSDRKQGGDGSGRKTGGKGEAPSAIADGSGGAGSSGGAGAGSAKATGPLLADAPLTLSGGREQARFTLTLGAAAGKGGEGDAEMVSAPRGRIAAGERGEQAADSNIRREDVPPEYEGIVKRVFERSR